MTNPELLPALHVHLYSSADELTLGKPIRIRGIELPTLRCEELSRSQFDLSFEQAAEQLQQLDRFYFEPDGSFAWTGSTPLTNTATGVWQLYGMLYDYGGKLQRVELQGTCPVEAWQLMLRVLGDARQAIIAQVQMPVCLVAARSLEKLWERAHA